jgi:hypothetical protein
MKLGNLMVINAIIAGIFGISFVVAPGPIVALYGVTGSAPLNFVAKLYGSSLIAFAMITWVARNANDSDTRKAIVFGLLVGDAIALVVCLIAQLGNVINALGWSAVVIYLFLTLGFGYFQFAHPEM